MTQRTVLFAVTFALSVAVGCATAPPGDGPAMFWPAAGVAALWGLLATSRRELALVGVLVGVVSAVGCVLGAFPVPTAVATGVADLTMALGVRLGMSWDPHGGRDRVHPRLSGLGDVYRFVAAVGGATATGAVLGGVVLSVGGEPATPQTVLGGVVRGLAAVVVVAAPGLALRDTVSVVTRRAVVAAVPHLLVTLAVLWFVFGPGRTLPLSFLPFALVFWAGLRLALPLALGQGLVVALGSLVLVAGYGGGPFGVIDDAGALSLTVQSYMLLAVGLSVVVATVQRERDLLLGDLATAARHAKHQAEDLRVITETIPDGIVVFDRSGAILLHNDAARQWLRADLAEGIHDPRLERRHPDGAAMDDEDRPTVRALAGETVHGAVLELRDTELDVSRIVAVDAVPMFDAGEELPDRALVVFHDVSDEQARLRALEAERERTARLISDAPHGVAVLDMTGRILQVNEALAGLAGRSARELVGLSFDDLSPAHRDKIAVYLERAVAVPGELLVGDWTIESPTGDEAHVSLTSRVLTADEDDEVILVNVVDFSDRRRYEERLTYLADHDALTGLPNRRRFDEVLDEHLRQAQRRGPRGALLLLDLDHFKEVNDTMGHDAGDQLIVAVGGLLRDTVRSTDLVARLGGDEFAVLLPDADQDGAEAVAEALVARVRAHCATLDGVRRRVTASVGVGTFATAAQQSVDPLALADMLLYDAKEAGRNRHAVLDPSGTQQPRTGARLEWTARVEAALESDAFELYLQPILDVRTGRVVAAEALLRLTDREEPVAPGRFIHVVERAGLAPRLDRWVVRNAVALLARLREHAPDLVLDVNLSAHSIGDEGVEREFLAALRRHDVPPQGIVVEATETAAVADVPAARAFSQRLAALGTRVAIDDFGAGFGSFYYLKHLPFDIVKIDGEFVAGAHDSAVDRAILRSIVGVAQGLGKETVAEFVAEAEVLAVVRELGVDYAQGYHIGEPVPFAEFVARHGSGGSSRWTVDGPARPVGQHMTMVGGEI